MAKNKDNQPTATSGKARKRKRKLRKATLPLASLPRPLREHIEALQIGSTAGYLDWCRQHGFVCGIYKTSEQLAAERLHAVRSGAEARVREARGMRRPGRVLRQFVDGRWRSKQDVPEALMPVQEFLSASRPVRRVLAQRLIRRLVDVCPDLLFERTGRGGAAEDIYLTAVLRLAEHPQHVCRDPEAWRPRSHNPRRRFASLARHLYGRFPVPGFLDEAWFDDDPEAAEHRRWFVLVGAGESLRGCVGLPGRCKSRSHTNKMVHFFLQAPDDYTVLEALRFGQVLGLDGSPRLAAALRGTRLCRGSGGPDRGSDAGDQDEFWLSVLRFFIRHPLLDTTHVGPILDYLHHQRFEHRDVVGADGRLRRLGPPQPHLSMRGRNPAALLRQVRDWHVRLGLAGGTDANVGWPPTGIPGFHSAEGDARAGKQRIWTIHELTTGSQLIAEGRKMQHCVATYIPCCRMGRSSIWSLQLELQKGPIRVLTIEVDNRLRQIVEARGRSNANPTGVARKVMARWAAAAGLTIASWV